MSFKSGFVTVIGRPNVGKSTLVNSLIGEKINIISPRPQTTRNSIKAIYTGVNIENASFSLTNCAERSAIFQAVSDGKRKIEALLIVTSTNNPVTPCGACRQVIQEFADGEIEIIMMTEAGKEMIMTSSELLPGAFSDSAMENSNEL